MSRKKNPSRWPLVALVAIALPVVGGIAFVGGERLPTAEEADPTWTAAAESAVARSGGPRARDPEATIPGEALALRDVGGEEATDALEGASADGATSSAAEGSFREGEWGDDASADSWAAASQRILVSVDQRQLWYIENGDTVMTVPVAVGKGTGFAFRGKTFRFETPRGTRRVLAKQPDPTWTPPVWHYYEKALARGLEVVELAENDTVALSDGSWIEVRDNRVGRVNARGQWWEWTPGMEVIFDGKIFVPPLRSPQRKIPNALGPYKLDLGEGYMIHGTHIYNEESVGQAVSHGCIRMDNADLTRLYPRVSVGTPVRIM